MAMIVGAVGWAEAASAQPGSEWQGSAWHLWRIEVDGSGLTPLDQTPGRRCGSPDWSSDGEFIAYDVMSGPAVYQATQIARIRADGSDGRLLGRGAIPSWSPDGKLIVCQSNGMTIMNADGSGREAIFENGFGLRWWPRGNGIASLGGNGITLFRLTQWQTQRIVSVPHPIEHGFDISPDGRRICFGSTAAGLKMATLDEDLNQVSVRQLVDGIAYHASWAPDGRRVVFAWRESLASPIQIYLLDVDSGEPPRLLPGLDLTRRNVNPDWSPDGKTIVFSSSAPLE